MTYIFRRQFRRLLSEKYGTRFLLPYFAERISAEKKLPVDQRGRGETVCFDALGDTRRCKGGVSLGVLRRPGGKSRGGLRSYHFRPCFIYRLPRRTLGVVVRDFSTNIINTSTCSSCNLRIRNSMGSRSARSYRRPAPLFGVKRGRCSWSNPQKYSGLSTGFKASITNFFSRCFSSRPGHQAG